jgi:hypothetical protein
MIPMDARPSVSRARKDQIQKSHEADKDRWASFPFGKYGRNQ